MNITKASVLFAWALVGLACLASVQAQADGTEKVEECPIFAKNANWCSIKGVHGVIYDRRGRVTTPNMLFHYKPNSDGLGAEGVPDSATCARLCKNWATSAPYKAGSAWNNNNDQECSFWTFGGVNDCYLYNDNVCYPGEPTSFITAGPTSEILPTSVSGGSFHSGCPEGSISDIGVGGDPHFTGADKSRFDFTGTPNTSYCIVTDAHLHINTYHGGRYGQWGENPHKALTWIRQVGILWGHHNIRFAAREGARWQYDSGYLGEILVDGEKVVLAQAGSSARLAGGAITVSWLAARERSADDEIDVYELSIEGLLRMRLKLRPEVENLRTEEDGVVHFDLEFPLLAVSSNVHGVLGQTYRRDHHHRLAEQKLEYNEQLAVHMVPGDNAEGFLDGEASDYEASGVLRSDCKASRFARAGELDQETAMAIELSSTSATNSLSTSRKFLRALAK